MAGLLILVWLSSVAAVAEPVRPAPSSVPAMATDAPTAASLGPVSLGTVEIRMKRCLPREYGGRATQGGGWIRPPTVTWGMPSSLRRGWQAAHDLIQ